MYSPRRGVPGSEGKKRTTLTAAKLVDIASSLLLLIAAVYLLPLVSKLENWIY